MPTLSPRGAGMWWCRERGGSMLPRSQWCSHISVSGVTRGELVLDMLCAGNQGVLTHTVKHTPIYKMLESI